MNGHYFFLALILAFAIGTGVGGNIARQNAMNKVHDQLAQRCEAPAVYSEELMACVTVQP
jgi:hypothetical protein